MATVQVYLDRADALQRVKTSEIFTGGTSDAKRENRGVSA